MATQNKKKRPSRSPVLKGAITAASIAATIGGWGLISVGGAQPNISAEQSSLVAELSEGTRVPTPTPPTAQAPSQSQPGVTQGRGNRRRGGFSQAPSGGSSSTTPPTTDNGSTGGNSNSQQGTTPLSPMGTTRSSR